MEIDGAVSLEAVRCAEARDQIEVESVRLGQKGAELSAQRVELLLLKFRGGR